MRVKREFQIYERKHRSGSPGWQVSLGMVNGKRKFQPFTTLEAAQTFKAQCEEKQALSNPAALSDLDALGRAAIRHALEKLKPYDATSSEHHVTTSTRDFFYSDQWKVLAESVDEGADTREFVWRGCDEDKLILRDESAGETPGRLYALDDGKNVTSVCDDRGTVQERYGYQAFGAPAFLDAGFDAQDASDYDWETLFCGYRFDAETGLYQVRYRYLHAQLGRWLSRDPIGYVGGGNVYDYVHNSAINAVDPTGLKTCGRECPDGEMSCPNGVKPSSNGCGPAGWKNHLVPNHPLYVIDFGPACDNHDICYGTCNSCKEDCDTAIEKDAKAACDKEYGSTGAHPSNDKLTLCYGLAKAYYEAVSKKGSSAYKDAQKESCKCCPKK